MKEWMRMLQRRQTRGYSWLLHTIGAIATLPGIGSIGLAMATTSAFFLAAAFIILALPDRSGQPLES